jgi:phage FluMu protein Com
MLSIALLATISKYTGWNLIYLTSYCPWCKNINSLGTYGSYSSFSTDISQIDILLSSLATAITDY